eukprot:TRINITY_DN6594_c0_g1_i2.p1 TRINITY_DN6594_c0_g1~~TRINITY_DN6594_c0_g1_i2.p1  ORF type:complete len:390 (+),score=87.49 TRINITY_DN6594_c0_g1_i2:64-1233(+)
MNNSNDNILLDNDNNEQYKINIDFSNLDITIEEYQIQDTIVIYCIKIRIDNIHTYVVKHRYNNFHELHESIKEKMPSKVVKELPKFPRKHRLRSLFKKNDEDFIKERMTELESYLRALIKIPSIQENEDVLNILLLHPDQSNLRVYLNSTRSSFTSIGSRIQRNSAKMSGVAVGAPLDIFNKTTFDSLADSVPFPIQNCILFIVRNESLLFSQNLLFYEKYEDDTIPNLSLNLEDIRNTWDSGEEIDFIDTFESSFSPYIAMEALKMFLSELPTSIITNDNNETFEDVLAVTQLPKNDKSSKIKILAETFRTLPDQNRAVLGFILPFLNVVLECEEENKCTVEKISKEFSKILFKRHNTFGNDYSEHFKEITGLLITNYEKLDLPEITF